MGFLGALTPIVEILVIAIILNYLLSFFWGTKSMDLLIGVLAFLLLFVVTSFLHLPILNTLLGKLASLAATAFLVIFQPELRVALSKLSLKGKRYQEVTEFDKFLDQLLTSVYRLAEKRIGALIVLEYEDRLDEYTQKGVALQAKFSSELLESIFATSTPLHDGAVIIRDLSILAAAVILPLPEDVPEMMKSKGTRHRAALGLSQHTDSVVIVVSEQSGKVSVAREGVITDVKSDKLKGIIHSLFYAPAKKPSKFSVRKLLGV